ncbi:MAG: hypothetical protein WCQ50_18490, partial [Spirochaetota bacterium]
LVPSGELKTLSGEAFKLKIASADEARGSGTKAAEERLLRLLKARRGDRGASFLAALARGDKAEARALAAGFGPGREGRAGRQDRADQLLFEAALSLSEGRAGEGLSSVYRAARREDTSLRPFATLLATDLGAQSPDFGSWPHPLVALTFALLAMAASLLVVARWRKLGRPLVSPLLIALAIAAILASAFSVMAIREAGTIHYLSWSPRLAALPSLDAESSLTVDPGRNGRRLASVPGWIYLRFVDGSSGWISDTMVYSW